MLHREANGMASSEQFESESVGEETNRLQKRLGSQMNQQATRDPLTGLFNRPHFFNVLRHQLLTAKRQSDAVALLLADLDNFRDINDSFGHQAGDEVLRQVASALRSGLNDHGVLARLGGDEFAILLPQANVEAARRVGQTMLGLLGHSPISVANRRIQLRVSLGVAVYPYHADNVESLLVGAEMGMYAAKSCGGNRMEVCASLESGRKQAKERLYWELRIDEALRNDGLILYWQPVLDLRRSDVVGYELLLRMKERENHVISPDAFLPVAERSDLISAIDRWVVRRAIQYLAVFQREQTESYALHVNLSAKAFGDDELLQIMLQEFERTAVNPSRLVLEITESTAIADLKRAKNFMDTLRTVGCRFALDDFGVGFSAFDTLRSLPIDFLKFDGSFVQNVVHNPVDRHLVRAMVDIARGLGIKTIAEYIPDQPTIDLLAAYGVDYGQGYYIGRPQPTPFHMKR